MNSVWCYLVSYVYYCAVNDVNHPTLCTTPNGESAVCKPLLSCPILRNAVAIRDPWVENFIQASAAACERGEREHLAVCCGTSANYTNLDNVQTPEVISRQKPEPSAESIRNNSLKLLPSKKYCGMQHADDYFRDYNTTETTVDELPWVMFVSCDDEPTASSISSNQDFALPSKDCDCSGVLINNRYVLTSSNCASAKWVGLGQREQYRNISCTATPYDDDCSEALAKMPFTEQFRNPNNTLLLLRLNSKITYTDYIRPICLPIEKNDRIEIGETITISKWKIDEKVRGYVRTKLNHTVSNNVECSYNFQELNLKNSTKYICTKTENDVTALCKADSGAPMMYKRENNWYVGGVLHSGYCIEKTAAGNEITPEVVNWILEHIKP